MVLFSSDNVDWASRSPSLWDKKYARGFVYVHTVTCERDGQRQFMYKVGRSLNPCRREREWQLCCPDHRHQLVAMVGVRYQCRTGKSVVLFETCGSIRRLEYWLHQQLDSYRFLVKCTDCGKRHREIFAIPGGRKEVVRKLKEVTDDIDGQLTNAFGF
jgi:hypothetical protein